MDDIFIRLDKNSGEFIKMCIDYIRHTIQVNIVKRYAFVLCLALSFSTTRAQREIAHYTVDDGLPSNEVYFVHQDSKGYFWFCTDKGVSRYNGYEFENFSTADGLTDNTVFKCFEDSKGYLWFTCFNGTITKYSLDKEEFESFEYNDFLRKSKLNSEFIHYIGFKDGDAYLFGFDNFTYFKTGSNAQKTKEYEEIETDVVYVIRNSGEKLSISCESVIDSLFEFDNLLVAGLFSPGFSSRNGIRFRSNFTVVHRLDSTSISIENRSIFNPYTYSNSDVTYVHQEGETYACRMDGLYMFKGNRQTRVLSVSGSTHMLPLDDQFLITSRTNGVYLFSRFEVDRVEGFNGLKNSYENFLRLKDNLIVFTNSSLAYKSFTLPSKPATISSLKNYSRREASNRIFHYDRDSSSLHHFHLRLKKKEGKLVQEKIVCDFVKYPDKYLELTLPYPLVEHYKNEGVNRDFESARGRLGEQWIQDKELLYLTSSRGLFLYNLNSKEYRKVTFPVETKGWVVKGLFKLGDFIFVVIRGFGVAVLQDGVLVDQNQYVNGIESLMINFTIFDDTHNRLWILSNAGIQVNTVYLKNGAIKWQVLGRLTKQKGLPTNNVTKGFLHGDSVYFSTESSLFKLPRDYKFRKSQSPIIQKLNHLINDSLLKEEENVFDYFVNSHSFFFESVLLQKPKNAYRYRLVAGDNEPSWTSTSSRKVDFNYLPPGKYEFQVSARGVNSDWGTIRSRTFTIQKAFYNEWWFRLVIISAILGLGYFLYTKRVQRIKEKAAYELNFEKLKFQMSKLESNSLRGQMNPHFVFNVLNSIQKLILKEEKENANKLLHSFSKLIRSSLHHSRLEFVSLEEEITFLTNYLNIELQRFPNRFSYEITVDETIEESIDIPPLLIQPLAENAIKHGFSNEYKGKLSIHFFDLGPSHLKISIQDDGIGFQNTESREGDSLGLKIIKERLDLFNSQGYKAKMEIKVKDESTKTGTVVILTIPCR